MKDAEAIPELIAEIRKNIDILDSIRDFVINVQAQDIKQLGKTQATALIIAGLLEKYYTCLETIFFRISQFFENDLIQAVLQLAVCR